MSIYYLESEGLTTTCQCMAIFIPPCSTRARILTHPVRMTRGLQNFVAPQTSGVFLWVALVGLVWGVWGWGSALIAGHVLHLFRSRGGPTLQLL